MAIPLGIMAASRFSGSTVDVITDTGLLSNAQAYYKLESYPSSVIVDSVAGTYPGGSFTGSFVSGKVNNAATFNGTNQRVSFGTGTTFGLSSGGTGISARTYSMWIYPTANTTSTIFQNGAGGATQIRITSSGAAFTITWSVRWSNSTFQNITSTGTYAINTWHHIFCTSDVFNNQGNLYVNGSLARSAFTFPGTGATANTTATQSTLGCGFDIATSTEGSFFSGYIDEFYIGKLSASSTQATHLYNSGNGRTYP